MRRFLVPSVLAVLLIGVGSSAAAARGPHVGLPAGLTQAMQARVSGTIRIASRAYDPAQGDPQMGTSVAMSADGTTALVGAPGVAKGKGAAYIFHVSSVGSWTSSATPGATLTLSGKGPVSFGTSVALSADGTSAFVGAPAHGKRVGLTIPGAIFVFHVASEEAWASTSTPTATLTVPDSIFLGIALTVSADGTTLLAGVPFSNGFGGGAEIFHTSAEDGWVSSTSPTATLSDPGQDLGVGSAVAISDDGKTALLSDTDANDGAGAADVFHVANEGAWADSSAPAAILSNESRNSSIDALGWSVALSGDGTTAFLGAPGNVAGSPTPGDKKTAGAVDVFHVSAADAWADSSIPAAILSKGGRSGNDALGALVAASTDGSTLVATAPGVHRGRGAADVFQALSQSEWTSSAAPTATLTNSAGTRTDFFGGSEISGGRGLGISTDGATVLVGAPGVNWNTGAADMFHVANASSWLTSSAPTAKLTNSALPRPVCVVPRLIGLNLSDAKYSTFGLAAHKCRLGRVRKVHAKKKWRRLIVSQTPAPGKHLRAGAKVNVKIGK